MTRGDGIRLRRACEPAEPGAGQRFLVERDTERNSAVLLRECLLRRQ